MGVAWKEQVIQELIAEGNDEQAVRMIDALWDLEPEQIGERIDLQMRLGRRYMVLALSQEGGGTTDEDVEALLERRFEQGIPLQSASDGQSNRMVLEWYTEADKLFSAALECALLPQAKGAAVTHRSFVHALCGAYDLALADLDQAQSFLPLSPDLSYWRGMIFAKLGAQEAARAALDVACKHDPENERYRRAYARVMRGCDV